MKKIFNYFAVSVFVSLIFASAIMAQGGDKETYTGTVLSYGSGVRVGSSTRTFTLNITGQTPDDRAQHYLDVLQNSGQDSLLSEIRNQNVGNFSVGGNLSRQLNVVREDMVDGKRRLLIVFERWTQFAEVRGGYRSLDYPFGYIELYIDDKTGKGSGTYIAAAKIRWVKDKKTNQYQIEIENFATYPAQLLGVTLRNRRSA